MTAKSLVIFDSMILANAGSGTVRGFIAGVTGCKNPDCTAKSEIGAKIPALPTFQE
jgi:hypothetical protein